MGSEKGAQEGVSPFEGNGVVTISGLRVVTTGLWAMAGMWLRSISQHTIHTSITGDNPEKTLYTGPEHLFRVYR